ncbi:PREDICTED: uncharacterized protein LOC107881144 [Prunus mume]|uniref:Uncharacterized protein LOC107881144 n=1 Tax=Prunus mume TaxID=102107 RepID=A0ABM1LQR2_PRUMU|nr:PREDICTED: uncharacterized protein LOC107881144 [Prunus mume]
MGAADKAALENPKDSCEAEEVGGANEKLGAVEAVADGVTVVGVEVVGGFERGEAVGNEKPEEELKKLGNEGVVEAEDDEAELNKGVEETEDELNRDEAEAEAEPIRGELDADTVESEEQNQDDGAEDAAEDLNPKEWAAAELGLEDPKAGAEDHENPVDVAGEMTGGLVDGKGCAEDKLQKTSIIDDHEEKAGLEVGKKANEASGKPDTPLITQTEEIHLSEVGNSDIFKVYLEIGSEDIIKESPKEPEYQNEFLEETLEASDIASETVNDDENSE